MVKYKSRSRQIFVVLNTLFLIILSLTMIIPLLNTFAVAFSTEHNAMQNSMIFFPNPFSIEGFDQLFFILDVGRQFMNTLYVTIVGTFLHILVCAMTAYALARYDFPGKGIFVVLLMITLMVPFQNIMIPTYLIFKKLHLLNTYSGLLVSGVVSGFTVILLRNFFEELPNSIAEAATIEGANEWQLIYKIFLPLAKPGLATVTIFTIVTKWNMYMEPLILITDPKKQMLQVGIRNLVIKSEGLQDMGIVATNTKMAAVMLSIIPLILMYVFAQKYFINGITLGSTKG